MKKWINLQNGWNMLKSHILTDVFWSRYVTQIYSQTRTLVHAEVGGQRLPLAVNSSAGTSWSETLRTVHVRSLRFPRIVNGSAEEESGDLWPLLTAHFPHGNNSCDFKSREPAGRRRLLFLMVYNKPAAVSHMTTTATHPRFQNQQSGTSFQSLSSSNQSFQASVRLSLSCRVHIWRLSSCFRALTSLCLFILKIKPKLSACLSVSLWEDASVWRPSSCVRALTSQCLFISPCSLKDVCVPMTGPWCSSSRIQLQGRFTSVPSTRRDYNIHIYKLSVHFISDDPEKLHLYTGSLALNHLSKVSQRCSSRFSSCFLNQIRGSTAAGQETWSSCSFLQNVCPVAAD